MILLLGQICSDHIYTSTSWIKYRFVAKFHRKISSSTCQNLDLSQKQNSTPLLTFYPVDVTAFLGPLFLHQLQYTYVKSSLSFLYWQQEREVAGYDPIRSMTNSILEPPESWCLYNWLWENGLRFYHVVFNGIYNDMMSCLS